MCKASVKESSEIAGGKKVNHLNGIMNKNE